MKPFVTLFLLIFTVSFSTAQTYRPLLDDLNEWHFTTCFSGCNTSKYYTDGDTLVDGLSYKILDGYHFISRTVLLREDTEQQKVYLFRILPGTTKNYLLYDFSKQEGDTMQLFNPLGPFIENPGFFVLDSIRLKQLVDGDSYRHFYWSPTDDNQLPQNFPVWIEGVGSASLINAAAGHPDINEIGQLSCFFKNSELFYSDLDSISVCEPTRLLGVSEITNEQIQQIYPNPTSGKVMWASNEVQNLRVLDFQGKLLLEKNIDHQQKETELMNVSNGIYIVEMKLLNGQVAKTKLIIEK